MTITTFTQLDPLLPLLNRQLQRGTLTNLTLTADEWTQELQDAPVTAWEWPDGVLLFRERDGKQLVSYALRPPYGLPDAPSAWDALGTCVVEIPIRPRDAETLHPMIPLFRQAGFQTVLQRIRVSRTVAPMPTAPTASPLVRPATLADVPAIRVMLQEYYSSLTGCLPTRPALQRDVQAGRIGVIPVEAVTDRPASRGGLPARPPAPTAGGGNHNDHSNDHNSNSDSNRLVALIQFTAQANKVTLTHFCTRSAFRRQGYGQALMDWVCAQTAQAGPTTVFRIWLEGTNQAAYRLYEANGYQPDGWTSTVLVRVAGQA